MNKKTMCLLLALAAVLFVSAALAACDGPHSYGSWRAKRLPTCTQQGHYFKYCRNCDHWEQKYTPKLKHEPGEITVTREPTCTLEGAKESICVNCGGKIRYTIDKLPHAYGEMEIVKAPTCTLPGQGLYVCADCGRKKNETIQKLGHDWGEVTATREATCLAAGSGEHTCLRCSLTQKVRIDKLAHEWDEWNVTREPSGRKKGVRRTECLLCGKEKTENFYWEGTLYQDMAACDEVIRLQQMLADLGYYGGNIRSGKFGELTTKAVIKIQTALGLEASGVADPETLKAIESEWERVTGKTAAEALDEEEMENAPEVQAAAA